MRKLLLAVIFLLAPTVTSAQAPVSTMPADYGSVLQNLRRTGDFKDGVLKVNIPRSDLKVTVEGIATPTAFGFGGWIAMTKGERGMDVMMGDLVLTEAEVAPVMTSPLDHGFDVTALHNHFLYDMPRMFYMHVHGHGQASDLATRISPALALIGTATPTAATAPGRTIEGNLDTAALARIVGTSGEQNGAVYKITIGRPDLAIKEMGALINARMGLNTWAAFYGTDADAVVAGDFAMAAGEITPVLKALRANNIEIVAIHHHMTGTTPDVFFLHYWGKGAAAKLAAGVKAALDQTGHAR